MQKLIKVALCLVFFSLTACSANNMSAGRPELDQEYIQRVEAVSRNVSHRPRIYWINPPIKKRPEQDQPDSRKDL